MALRYSLLFLVAIAFAQSPPTSTPPRPGVSDATLKKPVTAIQPAAVIQTDPGSDWVTVDVGSVWLSSKSKNTLTRIDPKTNTVAATIPIRSINPARGSPPDSAASGSRSAANRC